MTVEYDEEDLNLLYFNSHAHVERDSPPMIYRTYVRYFNSHAHVERDVILGIGMLLTIAISTHTLTWSVTQRKLNYGDYTCDFNSHAHVERDYLTRDVHAE